MASGQHLPSGTVSLLFTDIAGSTRLLEQLGDAYATLLSDHHRLVSDAIAAHGGSHVDAAGDGLFVSFPTARRRCWPASMRSERSRATSGPRAPISASGWACTPASR